MGYIRGNGFGYPNGRSSFGRKPVNIPLLVGIPIAVIVVMSMVGWYMRKVLRRRQLNQTLKEKAVPHIFSNVYVSHKAFKKELSQPAMPTLDLDLEKQQQPARSPITDAKKSGSQLSLFREEALAAAPLIFSGPKSAPVRTSSTASLGSMSIPAPLSPPSALA